MNPTIARMTVRGLLGRRRFLVLLLLPASLIGLTALSAATDAPVTDWSDLVLNNLGFGVVVPLVALIIGAGVLGNEIDDGTLVHILAKPVSRADIVLTKLVVGVAATLIMVVPAVAVSGALTDGAELSVSLGIGAALSGTAYCVLFAALSLMSRRPVLVGLGYILVWETLLSNFLSGTEVLSIREYGVSVADDLAGTDLLNGELSVVVALIMAGVLVVGAAVVSVQRLRSFQIAGETG